MQIKLKDVKQFKNAMKLRNTC